MPIYEYGCGDCGHVFEELIMSGEVEPDECPACGTKEVGRLVSSTAFQLKGSGWYVTDYKDTGSSSKDSDPSTKDSKPSEGSSDSSKSSSDSADSGASTSSSDADTAA